MKKITWKELTILSVSGVSLMEAETVIAPHAQAFGEEIRRIYEANDGGVLIQLRDTDDDAEKALELLEEKFGKHRITEICRIETGRAA